MSIKSWYERSRASVAVAETLWKLFAFVVVLCGGTTAGLLAKTNQVLAPLGPLMWFAIAVVSMLALALVIYLVQAARLAAAQATFTNALASKPSTINPLANSFSDVVIPIASLHLPSLQVHERKLFRACKIVGPGAIALIGGNSIGNQFTNTGHLISVADGTQVTGLTVLQDCTIENCEFVGVTVLIPRSLAARWATQGVPVSV